ncbi:MAG: LysM peptidoglycan-binding domain-containing protein, partial [Burkholderiales bacterium]
MRLALAVLTLLAVLAGCTTRAPAPVDDRRPAAQAKPSAVKAAPPTARADTYTIKRGDTLYSIALEHGVDYRELARWNGLDDPARIRVGQSLRVRAPEEKPAAGVRVGSVRTAGDLEARPLGTTAGAATGAPPADAGMKTTPKALRLPYSEQNLAALQKPEAAKP